MANEKRLIWDEDAKRHIIALAVGHHTDTLPVDMVVNAILHYAPTVDAVEVVRCKDCKHYCNDKRYGTICIHPALDYDVECYAHWLSTEPDDFCSYGERRTDGETERT